jgi:DNA-binding transcriptional MerR regulator
MESLMTIGKVARQTAVNVQTVRYYERIGLLNPHARRESGYRLYTEEAIRRIRFIKRAQQLGFELKEVRALREKAEDRLHDVQEKIDHLRRMERALLDLIRRCHRRVSTDPCPILRSLETVRGSGPEKAPE